MFCAVIERLGKARHLAAASVENMSQRIIAGGAVFLLKMPLEANPVARLGD